MESAVSYLLGLGTLRLIGLATVTYVVGSILRCLYGHFLAPAFAIRKYAGEDRWAIITGASDGIGKAFAEQLAQFGFKRLILVSRTASKLQDLAKELEAQYRGLKCKIIACDLSNFDVAEIEKQITGFRISLLINNVGVNTELFKPLHETAWNDVDQMVKVNVVAMLKLTHSIVGRMVASGGGLIINLSSFTGVHPVPLMAVYSSTKAFVNAFSDALHWEYAEKKVRVVSITPYFVVSAMTGIKRATMMVPAARKLASDALLKIGNVGVVFSPYFLHDVMEKVMGLLPRPLVAKMMMRNMEKTTRHLERKIQAKKKAT